jgi:hypothetical protein
MLRAMKQSIQKQKKQSKKQIQKQLVPFLAAAVLAVGVLAVPGDARADDEDGKGFIEAVVGQAMPLGEDQWDDAYDTALKLGVRGGVWARHGIGLELAFDYTSLDETDTNVPGFSLHTDIDRYRFLVGGRGGTHVARNVLVFGRLLVGADYMRGSYNGELLGNGFDGDDSDVGLGVEIGGGVLINLANVVSIGAQLAIPMAFHFNEQDANNGEYVDNEYNAYDLDLLLTAGTSF